MADRASRAYRKLLKGNTTGSRYGAELKKQVRQERRDRRAAIPSRPSRKGV